MPPPTLALVLAHIGGPEPTGPYWTHWQLQPTVLLGVLALLAAYVWLAGPGNRRRPDAAERVVTTGQRAAFYGGLLVLLVALGPPMDDWSDRYLLSAHMVQHLLLTLLVPPLLLLGTPGWMLEPLARNRVANAVGYALTRPAAAYLIANGVLVLWHMPFLYDAALANDQFHAAEHMLFLGTSLLAWWPVVGPLPAWPRLPPLGQCLYLFLWTIPGSIVGAFIVYAEPGLYAPYANARRIFGIDLATDQQVAGLLMWVATSTVFLVLTSVVFFRHAGREEARDRAAMASRAAAGAVPPPRP